MAEQNAVECIGVTKHFGNVVANDNVSLSLKKGEILSLLGENGSGKTTLMNMLSGIYFPDSGKILINGKEEIIRTPKDAFNLRIGMVHQHYKLIDIMSAAENIILGMDPNIRQKNFEEGKKYIKGLVEKYGFSLDPNQKVYNMSVSQKQTTEIVKTLYKGADILILDEPTAVLTPQETEKLFNVLRAMRADGKSIIVFTHKLAEVLEISDRVTVLRKGKMIGTVDTKDATVESLTEMMVGEKVSLDIGREEPVNPHTCIEVQNLKVKNGEGIYALDDVSFSANSGEILGVAGISGSGQREFLETLAGVQGFESGKITYYNDEGIADPNIRISLAFVPEDRLGMGLIETMGITDNMMLRSYREGRGPFVDRSGPRALAQKVVDELGVVTPSLQTPVSRLSGGNVQKVLLGREISLSPKLLLVAYPTRGLDINSSFTIYRLLNEQKKKGVAVICVIEDLDVLMELSDRILVLSSGKVAGIEDARTVTKDRLGLLMAGGEK